LEPIQRPTHGVSLDGGTHAQRLLWAGCVTGFDEHDCLAQIEELLEGVPLPPVAKVVPDVDVSSLAGVLRLDRIGVPFWRGVWYPPQLYRTGP
jgi:hypothetical protein